jgi:signal-transduction protein with cAMP-binding, CBS, and nucleotidyltransferase domain
MKVREMCTFATATCPRETSVLALAKLMRERHVGDVIVVEEREGGVAPVGIVTDRDLVIQVMAKGLDPAPLCAGDLLSRDCVTVLDSDLAYDAIWHMRRSAVRRLPVVDARGVLMGVVTMDDINRFLAQELSDIARIAARQVEVEVQKCARDRDTDTESDT